MDISPNYKQPRYKPRKASSRRGRIAQFSLIAMIGLLATGVCVGALFSAPADGSVTVIISNLSDRPAYVAVERVSTGTEILTHEFAGPHSQDSFHLPITGSPIGSGRAGELTVYYGGPAFTMRWIDN